MTRGHVLAGRVAVAQLVVKEDVRSERLEERPLWLPTQKQGLIDTDVPCPKGPNHPLVRGCGPCRHQGRSDRRCLRREEALDPVKGA